MTILGETVEFLVGVRFSNTQTKTKGGVMTSSDTGTGAVATRSASGSSMMSMRGLGTVFQLKTTGMNGQNLLRQVMKKGHEINDYGRRAAISRLFIPTSCRNRVLLVRGEIFSDDERKADLIHAHAEKEKLLPLTPELAYLFRRNFSRSDFRKLDLFQVVALNKPKPSAIVPLEDDFAETTWQIGDGGLSAYHCKPDEVWDRGTGFVFLDKNLDEEE